MFESKIFSFFGRAAKLLDTYKDSNNKGFLERFNEIVGSDADENITPYYKGFLDKLNNPFTLDDIYLDTVLNNYGSTLYLGETFKRTLVKYFFRYVSIRTSKKCYELLFSYFGITEVTFNFVDISSGLDSEGTLDDGHLDSYTECCNQYDVYLTGNIVADQEFIDAAYSIIKFNETLNSIFRCLYLNGVILFCGNKNLGCTDISINSPSIGSDLIVTIVAKNTTDAELLCTIEIDFDYEWENGGTELDSSYIYETEDGVYETYNFAIFNTMILTANSIHSIVLGVISENLTAIVEYQILDSGILRKAGILEFMVNSSTLQVNISERNKLMTNVSDINEITFTGDIQAGNVRLNVITTTIPATYTFNYRFI